jgi:hypothetical protein
LIGTITWAAIAKYCAGAAGGQLYTVLDEAMLIKGQNKAPNGFDWATLQADFKALPQRGGLLNWIKDVTVKP